MKYLLMDGTEVSAEQIRSAYESGHAVIVHGNGDHGTTSGLMLDGAHRDTRGTCHSIWEEVWTRSPVTLRDAMDIANDPHRI